MSDWRQVGDLRPSPTQTTTQATTRATVVTPSNYYNGLDSDSISGTSDSISVTSSAFLPNFWKELQRAQDSEPDPSDSDNSNASIDSYDSIDDYNMVDYKQIRDLMETKRPGSTRPTTEPTTIQLHHFKKTLVSALAKCPLNASNKGHTYIIETLDEHRARNVDNTANLPAVPMAPTRPSATADRATLSFYNHSVAEYNTHIEYNAQTLAIIQSTYPGILNGMMIEDDLPDDITGMAALKHTFNTVLDTIASRTSYIVLHKAIYDRIYTPTTTGPVIYFAECDNDNLLMIRMHRAPHPPRTHHGVCPSSIRNCPYQLHRQVPRI